MADWCHEIVFLGSNDGDFTPIPLSGLPTLGILTNSGWKNATYGSGGTAGSSIYIGRSFSPAAQITQVTIVTNTVTLQAGSTPGTKPGVRLTVDHGGGQYLGTIYYRSVGEQTWINPAPGGSWSDVTMIRLNAWNAGHKEFSITGCIIHGTGVNPFTPEETEHEAALDDTFAAIRDALHTNPEADISALVTDYKEAIESAFGVTFDKEETDPQIADDWVFISLHFARLGLEATAKAFEQWVEEQIMDQNLCKSVDRYALFQRIMGNVRFRNMTAVQSYVAENKFVTEGAGSVRAIAIYRRSSGGQWYMTPNNVIHELGHWFDTNAGLGHKRLGSLEYSIQDEAKGGGEVLEDSIATRAGMAEGRDYLHEEAHEHAHITNNNGVAEYDPLSGEVPEETDAEYGEFVPGRYLFYDVAEDEFDVWRSPVYTNRYGENARFDALEQNAANSLLETAADAFLNWVRDQEYLREYTTSRSRRAFYDGDGEDEATAWIDFFADNIGMFLRNAAIYNYPGRMVQFYKDRNEIPEPEITDGSLEIGFGNYGLHPSAKEITNVHWGTAAADLSDVNSIPIYGWVTPTEAIGDGSSYWLLIADSGNRLCWIEENAIDHNTNLLDSQNESDAMLLSPDRPYSNTDLSVILGE
jgi:hypothetical protein